MIGDLLAVRSCGFDFIETNMTINTLIKKNIFCFLHVGKFKHGCPGMNTLTRILNASLAALLKVLGLTPIHIIIKSRRIRYIHYLVRLDKDEMLYKVFLAQWKYPVKDDWTDMVKQDMKDLKIGLSFDEIRQKTEWSFKNLLKIKTKEYALQYLLKMKQKHSKMTNLEYKELTIQNYFKNENISVKEAQNLFKFRTRVAKFRENFKNNYEVRTCHLCLVQPDTQAHCVQCPVVKENIHIRGD